MLKPNKSSTTKAAGSRFAIVASEYNGHYVDSMLRAANKELKRAGAREIQLVRVPGAYEIPLLATRLAREHREAFGPNSTLAIICLGVILRGETVHAAHIGEAVSRALMEIQLRYEVPVIHEVLLLENEDQARARCLNPKHNRGREAAQTALKMAKLISGLPPSGLKLS